MEPSTDRELVKECMAKVSELMFPENRKKTGGVGFSRFTVCRRTDEITASIEESSMNTSRTFQTYSLAPDESMDSGGTAQFVFIRGIDCDFNVTEEMAALQSMKDTASGTDLMEELEKAMVKLGLGYSVL
jgi:hypothetical protein